MNFLTQHILQVIAQYHGSVPLAIFLKSYSKQHPKLGSRDRKALAEGVYIFYRSVLFLDAELDTLETIKQGYYLCKSQNSYLAKMLNITPEDSRQVDAYAPELGVPLSASVDEVKWLKSHWQQPRVYIRIVQNEGLIFELLDQNNVAYIKENFPQEYGASYSCISVHNSAPIDKILFPEDYVIQDRSSQIALLIATQYWKEINPKYIWDVCSGAGGKTLLIKQLNKEYKILASDVRKSILFNLKGRCHNYGIDDITTKQIDATLPSAIAQQLGKKQYDIVLCDVPCSGSGTWSRTPEQLYFFNAEFFDQFAHLQYPIAHNTIPYIKKGGIMVYITCSVMHHENEHVVTQLQANDSLELLHQEMILGMDHQADTLFVSIFKKL
jgi:16S rRNA (cytosine967-C5)-methyltransferase